jgi:hypothetical protein
LFFGRFRDKMLAKNYELKWHEWPDGHVYGNFRAHQDNAYILMFPSEINVGIVSENHRTKEYILFQNYPNPFNPTTNFGLRISDLSA